MNEWMDGEVDWWTDGLNICMLNGYYVPSPTLGSSNWAVNKTNPMSKWIQESTQECKGKNKSRLQASETSWTSTWYIQECWIQEGTSCFFTGKRRSYLSLLRIGYSLASSFPVSHDTCNLWITCFNLLFSMSSQVWIVLVLQLFTKRKTKIPDPRVQCE